MADMNDGGPAFPTRARKAVEKLGCVRFEGVSPGMSLRDWFAGQALTGILSSISLQKGPPTSHEDARLAYDTADEMLKERDKNWVT